MFSRLQVTFAGSFHFCLSLLGESTHSFHCRC